MVLTLKVTIRPIFFGTVPNFEGPSQKIVRSFGTLNCSEFPTLSQTCPDYKCQNVLQFKQLIKMQLIIQMTFLPVRLRDAFC